MNIVELYDIFRQYPSVQTDTRKLRSGDLFFALRGPNFDANAFAATALANGAAYAIIDDPAHHREGRTIVVPDVLATLQELALFHRNQLGIPVIAITGSNGKTTTKELVHAVLSSTYRTSTTVGNLNNHIGVPLTLLSVKPDAEVAVVEMGANHVGEIASYCQYTRPDYGLITNAGKAHLEGFGGYEGVKKGKGELYDFLRASGGKAFVMWDYDYLREMSAGIPEIITYGTENSDSGRPDDNLFLAGRLISGSPFLSVALGGLTIQTQLVGAYNLPNVLAAAAIGKYFNIPATRIRESIEAYSPGNSRSQLVQQGSNRIILDAYNANPTSMRAAIENFAKIDANDKVLMLGAMAELGEESLAEHEAIVALIDGFPWKAVVLVGGDFLRTNSSYITLENSAEAQRWFASRKLENTHILIKGSRSMQMERVLENNPSGE